VGEDNPPPLDLPAAALRGAVSGVTASVDKWPLSSHGITARANRERQVSTPCRPCEHIEARSGRGHEEQLPPQWLNGRCRFRQRPAAVGRRWRLLSQGLGQSGVLPEQVPIADQHGPAGLLRC
jgi:hypothetical protein